MDIFETIKTAINESPRNDYTAELHLQIIKFSEQLAGLTAKEFCQRLEIAPSYGTEFSKMIKIAPRLRQAGLNPEKI